MKLSSHTVSVALLSAIFMTPHVQSASVQKSITARKPVLIDAAAEAIPVPMENRIVRYTYSPDIIFRVFTQPNRHTFIELGEDEGLTEEPKTGDSIQWRVSGGPRNIYVKPNREGIETSLTIVTNKRSYIFQLISGKRESKLYQKVSFDYPDRIAEIRLRQDNAAAVRVAEDDRLREQVLAANVSPAELSFEFDISGDATFKPTAAYTDGKATYLRMPNSQDSPAVFLIEDDGSPSLINYKVKGELIVVERVAQHLLLKLGKAEVKISKRKPNHSTFWR